MQYFKTIAHMYKRIKKWEQINRKFVLYNKIFTMQYMWFDNNDVMYEGVRTELMLYIFYRPTTL